MTRDEILTRLTRTMVEMFELEPGQIRPEARLYEDLDLDSIDAVDMAVEIQGITGRRVEEQALRKIRTVGDVVELVAQMSAAAP